MKNFSIVLIVHNIRSTHNVGSLLRSADGFGVTKVYFTGYTPYPARLNDERLPHISAKINKQIQKTALGAEKSVKWEHIDNVVQVINDLRKKGYLIAAIEQTPKAKDLSDFYLTQDTAIIVGNEVEGLDSATLLNADDHLQIPMQGNKESFNVSIAGSIALYHLRQQLK